MATPLPPLHAAVDRSDLALVQALLAAGHDPNELDERGNPPLRRAVHWQIGYLFDAADELIIIALVNAGADLALRNVAVEMVADADAMVCSSFEYSEANRLARLLGVRT